MCKLISVGRAFIRQEALFERGRLVRLFTVVFEYSVARSNYRAFAAKPSCDLPFIKLWAIT